MYLAESLASYADGLRFDDLDHSTVLETKKRIIDALGCAIGSFREPPVVMSRRAAARLIPRGPSTMLGTTQRSSPDISTFVNGLMIRYFDYNDTYLSKEPAHPSDNLGPCISVAESEGASGRELILALVLGYEVQCRLCDAADIRHRGWDHVCYGLVSSALLAGKLMGLSRRKLTQSVNIALNGHIAMRQVRAGELSMWKGASFSNAARNSVFSAVMAREGFEGPSPIFEGEMGFFKQVSGPFELDTATFGGRNGAAHGFKINETYIKFYPAEYHSQSAVWAALELRRAIGDPSEIESVLIQSHEAGYSILGKDPEKWEPKTRETADHSLPYIVGMALLEGGVDNSTYSPRKFTNPATLEFLRRIRVEEDPNLTALYPAKGMPNRITVKLKSGRTVTKEVIVPKGHPKNPMTNAEIEEKFRRLTSRFLTSRQVDRALEKLWNLERQKDVSSIMSDLTVKR